MRRLICSYLFWLIMPAALAGTDLPIQLESNAEAKISVSGRLRNLPPSGFAPIAININNDSAREQSWSFQFNSPSISYLAVNSMAFAVSLTVPSKSTRAFNILVPLGFRGEIYSGPLGVTVSGPWTNGQSRQQFSSGNRAGKPPTAFVAMSDTLAAASWSQLEKEFEDGKKDLIGTRFVPDDLPDDWRGLVGIAGLWLTVDELNFLWPVQRAALREWVYRGGSLFVHGVGDLDPQFRSTGFGQISVMPEAALDITRTAAAIEELKLVTLETQLGQQYAGKWKAVTALGPIELNASLLIGFMALFAIVAGPVNLFVFARRAHRHRLFWTTPLISIATTGALLILIIWHDGLGGSGSRVALIYVSPTEKQDVLLQEQIARTGVVLASSFATKDPCYIAPIALDVGPSSPKHAYENSGTSYGGEWFVSRAVQAHWLESIAPTRAGIVFANATTTGESAVAPVIVSNISGVLEMVYFRDDNGRAWRASNVRTGQRVTMESEERMPDLLPPEAGSRLSTMWSRVRDRKGYFYAISRDSNSLIGTLPSIRWKKDCAIYLGPLSNSGPRS
jgi:hypothetical protein